MHKGGRREVTAEDIECDPTIEILNPDLHIAWLNETGKLKMEMSAQTGRGYDQAEKNTRPSCASTTTSRIRASATKWTSTN